MAHEWKPYKGSKVQRLGAVTASSADTTVTSGAAAKGSYVSLGTTEFDWQYMILHAGSPSVAAVFFLDLSIYDGANEWIIAADIMVNQGKAGFVNDFFIPLPLFIPKGSEIRCRLVAVGTTGSLQVGLFGMSRGPNGAPGYSRCVYIGGVLADPGGTANTKARTELTAATSRHFRAFMFGVDGSNDLVRNNTAWLIGMDIGAAAAEAPLIGDIRHGNNPTMDMPMPNTLIFCPIPIPSGSRLCANLQCSVTTAGDRSLNVHAWGFV